MFASADPSTHHRQNRSGRASNLITSWLILAAPLRFTKDRHATDNNQPKVVRRLSLDIPLHASLTLPLNSTLSKSPSLKPAPAKLAQPKTSLPQVMQCCPIHPGQDTVVQTTAQGNNPSLATSTPPSEIEAYDLYSSPNLRRSHDWDEYRGRAWNHPDKRSHLTTGPSCDPSYNEPILRTLSKSTLSNSWPNPQRPSSQRPDPRRPDPRRPRSSASQILSVQVHQRPSPQRPSQQRSSHRCSKPRRQVTTAEISTVPIKGSLYKSTPPKSAQLEPPLPQPTPSHRS